jgi:hypothetical protein
MTGRPSVVEPAGQQPDAVIKRVLRIGPTRARIAAVAVALATTAAGATLGLEAQLVLVAAVLVGPLIAERGPRAGQAPSGPPPVPAPTR